MNETTPVQPWAAALGRIPSGQFVLTARHGAQETGMLASWVMQCAFEPPHVSVAVKRGRLLEAWLQPGVTVVVNILHDAQKDVVVFFAKGVAPSESALTELSPERTADGTAILPMTLAYLECRVTSAVPAGDHQLLVAEVVGGRLLNEGQPKVHLRKNGLHY